MRGVFADQIRFSYRNRLALSDVSFELSPGVTGLLGPNGAGKSTLMNLLATVRRQQSGTLTLGGFDSVRERDEARRITGYLPQRFELLPTTSVLRNVEYAAWARGLPMDEAARAAEEILRAVDLWDRRATAARGLSGGMRQRLGIACAVVHKPAIVVLDEPTVGLDPIQRVGVRNLVRTLSERATVLVSTHLLEDLVSLTSAVLVLSEGRIRFTGQVSQLEELGRKRESDGLSAAEAGYAAVLQEFG